MSETLIFISYDKNGKGKTFSYKTKQNHRGQISGLPTRYMAPPSDVVMGVAEPLLEDVLGGVVEQGELGP